jgi:hypothetical protein
MQEVEKKRQEEMDSKMNVTIDLVKGTTTLKANEEDSLFTFGAQNQMANDYMGKQAEEKREAWNRGAGKKYLPFESEDTKEDIAKT